MEFLVGLWLPIVISTIVLFFASFIARTILPHHRAGWHKLDHEPAFMNQLQEMNIPPGSYVFPYAETRQQSSQETFLKTYAKGPRGTINIHTIPNLGLNLFCTFIFFLITVTLIAYIAQQAFAGWSDESEITFLKVFQIVGTISVLTYSSSTILSSISSKRPFLMEVIDGIAYGLIVGVIFASFHFLGWTLG